MQSLILEILNAQPSLRDSKTYLNSFGPRPRPPQPATPAFSGSKAARPRIPLQLPASLSAAPSAEAPAPQGPAPDLSHAFSHPDHAVRNVAADAASAPLQDATQPELAAAAAVHSQQHTALVKVQGPFTARQLDSIAEGMVYLKKLGLVSVIVLDSEEPAWRSATSRFSPIDGARLDVQSAQEREDAGLAPWSSRRTRDERSASSAARRGRGQEALRSRMVGDVFKLAELLSQKGASARPFPQAVMRVDAAGVRAKQVDSPPLFPDRAPRAPSRSAPRADCWAAGTSLSGSQATPGSVRTASTTSGLASSSRSMLSSSVARSPLSSDDDLMSLRSALASDQIPVLAPVALYEDPLDGGAERTVCVSADDILVGLARDMSAAGREQEAEAARGVAPADGVDMMPLRLMVINREGGIPSHARGGNPHLSINLASEYAHIVDHFIWARSHPTALANLATVQDCLSYMPHTSSGVVVSHRSPRSLIANLITNKAAHSPSLPHQLLANRSDVRHTPTIIRPGLDIRVISDMAKVDRGKLTRLLEESFRRTLDADAYYARLERSCDFVIVTGDYQAAAIVTREYAPGDVRGVDAPIAYLDKFAVLPSLQGSGTVDFLWGALRDEVHGLGLLDALNDNGGAGGFGVGRDLVWKSRADNPVNRWYYERSNGFARIDTRPAAEQRAGYAPAWSMFWCDAEDRISRMAGERRLGAEASPEDVMDYEEEQALQQREQQQRRQPHAHARSAAQQGYENDDDDAAYDDLYMPLTGPRDPSSGRLLSELDPRPGGAGAKLLPVVAPEEEGRLERWARCMATVPTAWR
jgi:amino-acid N-acetyltransferase